MVAGRDNSLQRRRGFTLLELLVVLAIAGGLMALVPPLVAAVVPGTKARVAVLDLAATLRDARYRAITRSESVDVRFDSETASYQLVGSEQTELPRGMALVLLESSGYDSKTRRAARFSRPQENYTLRFYADGSSNGLRARLGGTDNGYVIVVDWLLGRVSITGAGDHVS